jgi:hypothetical protein
MMSDFVAMCMGYAIERANITNQNFILCSNTDLTYLCKALFMFVASRICSLFETTNPLRAPT